MTDQRRGKIFTSYLVDDLEGSEVRKTLEAVGYESTSVQECELFVGVYGEKFSRTLQQEFDEAINFGKPVLLLLKQIEPYTREFSKRLENRTGQWWRVFELGKDAGVLYALKEVDKFFDTTLEFALTESAPASSSKQSESFGDYVVNTDDDINPGEKGYSMDLAQLMIDDRKRPELRAAIRDAFNAPPNLDALHELARLWMAREEFAKAAVAYREILHRADDAAAREGLE
ncbi:MAG: hypothetical protein LC672_01985, partial [Acidobacteria bacterium]|nr:hypothetical protein [Acidobacteriota bacterium]